MTILHGRSLGQPDGVTIKSVVSSNNAQLPIMEVIQAQLAQSGITLDMQVVEDASQPHRVTVFCGGQRFTSPGTAPRGEASAPLGWDDLRGKAAAIAASLDAPGLADALDRLAERLSAGRAADPGAVLAIRLDAGA